MSDPTIRRVLGSASAFAALFLVEHRGVLSVVDTGSSGALRRIRTAIGRAGWQMQDVRQIVLTHCHGDHAGEAKALVDLTGATVVAGALDAEVIEGSGPYPAPRDRLSRSVYRRFERFARLPVDRRIDVEEELEGGLVAIPTPGHTLGHIAVHAPDASAVFVGDAVWHLGPLRPSWRRYTVDPQANAESLRRLASLGADRIVVAHGPSVAGHRIRDLAAR